MKLIQTIKTIYLEFRYLREYVNKKTKERLLQKKLNSFQNTVDLTRKPSAATRELFKTHIENHKQ